MSDYMDTAFGTPPWNNIEADKFDNEVAELAKEIFDDMKIWEVLEDATRDFISEYTGNYEVELAIRELILPRIKKLYD